MKEYICHFDGSCEPINPGGTIGIGVFIEEGMNKHEHSSHIPPNENNTNNVAEYMAVTKALSLLKKKKDSKIEIYGDSKMVVEQLSGRWKVKKGSYVKYARQAKELFDEIAKNNDISIYWVPRDDNEIADDLSKKHLEEM